jgi:hypothetical protein
MVQTELAVSWPWSEMTEDAHIPADEFASALAGLGVEALAAFVGAVWAGTAEEVTVDPPVITVQKADERIRLVAVAGRSDPPVDTEGVDAVVTADDGSVEGEVPIVGPAELRKRLLYGLAPAEADALCERFLGVPARSQSYASDSQSDDTPGHDSPGNRHVEAGPLEQVGTGFGRLQGTHLAAALVVALLLLAVGGVTGPVAEQAGDGGDGTDSELATATPVTAEPDGEEAVPGGTPTPTVIANVTNSGRVAGNGSVDPDWGEVGAERYDDLEPTCNRSYLHVVQIQMNALKYNDPETDDGIRTVRRFASPRNREAVGSFEQFVGIIESQSYAPMLSYDSVTYTPSRTGQDTASVRVTTRENGTVTGQYEFRLRKQGGGKYDGCWMTDGVQSLLSASGPTE